MVVTTQTDDEVTLGNSPETEEDRPRQPSPTAEAGRAGRVVHARDLHFSYGPGVPVLRGIDLDIGVGEIVALIGPSGSGKSTLLRILAGDLSPTSGTVELPGRRSSSGHLMLGYAAREGAHFEELSGWDNALFFARAGGVRRRDAPRAVGELVDVLDLESLAHEPVWRYDDNARHRLMLVEALAHRPALTLLEHPFEGLGQRAREALIHILRLRSAHRGTVVMASESLSLIPEVADRILFIHEGRIVMRGRVAELLSSVGPATRLEIELERRPQHLDVRFRAGIDVVSDGDPYVVEVSRGRSAMGEVLAALTAAGATVRSVTVRESDLAEVFRRATGVEIDR